MLSPTRLRILTFPQRINGRALAVRVLLLPTEGLLQQQMNFPSVLNPGTNVSLPTFISGSLSLTLDTIQGLASYPFSDKALLAADGIGLDELPTGATFPAGLPALYEGVAAQFTIKPGSGAAAPAPDSDGIHKYLPQSYRSAFNFTNPRTDFARTDDAYHCAIRKSSKANPLFPAASNDVTWGRVLALVLRQPLLAERMGLVYRLDITLPADDYFKDGGWIACRLIGLLPNVDPDTELRSYAARIPPIDTPRQLFGAVLFPYVANAGQVSGNFDTLKIEAADYDDGFAKIVHAVQPVSANLLSEAFDGQHPQKDIGIRLGWDDEQILIWLNRQLLADPSTPGSRIEAPLGVFSYRADVRKVGDPTWHSLVRTRSKAALTIGGELVAPAGTIVETGVQVFPSTVNGDPAAPYWLPSYFTQWYGRSLVLPDDRAAELDVTGALANPGTYSDANISAKPQVGNLYEALLPDEAELKYGTQYEFRVRLADLAGGGPREDEAELNDAPSPQSKRTFQRFVAPKALLVTPEDPQDSPGAGSTQFYQGHSFSVSRPRLGYPALLFTELDTDTAFQKLKEDRDALHKNKPAGVHINDYREVSYFDPDVDQMLIAVDVKTLALDTQGSESKREPYLRLYTALRTFDPDLETPFDLEIEYRTANVIDFNDPVSRGDLSLSDEDVANGVSIVLPRSRDIRITLYPVCSTKPLNLDYFGFEPTRIGDDLHRVGESTQFFVREDANDEHDFFVLAPESHQLQGIYLQPDPPQINNLQTLVATIVAGTELTQSTVIERLAAQLGLDPKGQTLVGRPGQRIQFGCSNRIRHTLAPDNSSITFATADELINHWLCVLIFDVQRDWTWDGLASAGIRIERQAQFTGEGAAPPPAIVGYVGCPRTASRLSTTDPDRSRTRIVFIDAVEPKKSLDAIGPLDNPFPNTLDITYTVTPAFIAAVPGGVADREAQTRDLRLPVTTIPAQVPKIVAAGYALSPYQRTHDYSETAVRDRAIWFEFEEPIKDPHDTYFARVLAYAPDPLLAFPNPDQILVRQDDPPLAIDPELIRVITHGQGNDAAGLDAMQPMTPETPDPSTPLVKISPVHYLLPLPPGTHAESPELFGFFTYEIRVGHTKTIWCTAHGRFGHPTRISGVQHPAPPLKLLAQRTPGGMSVSASYATAVFGGRNVTSRPPKTEIWCMLYAQVMQADARQRRNLLLAEGRLEIPTAPQPFDVGRFLNSRQDLAPKAFNSIAVNLDTPQTGLFVWNKDEIGSLLDSFDLPGDTPLSVLAVEMMPRYDQYLLFTDPHTQSVRPLSADLGQYRILRTSRLVAAPDVCCENC
jgi:hypothetical protein